MPPRRNISPASRTTSISPSRFSHSRWFLVSRFCSIFFYFLDCVLQQAYFKCAHECFDRRRKHDEISNCVEHCSVPVLKAQNLVENEMAKFQVNVPSVFCCLCDCGMTLFFFVCIVWLDSDMMLCFLMFYCAINCRSCVILFLRFCLGTLVIIRCLRVNNSLE